MDLLNKVVNTLCIPAPLPPANKDHRLVGNYADRRECHITPDWLLIYRIDGNASIWTELEPTLICSIYNSKIKHGNQLEAPWQGSICPISGFYCYHDKDVTIEIGAFGAFLWVFWKTEIT